MARWQKCTGCGVTKAHTLRNFYRCKTGKHGLRIKCKQCVRRDVYENRALKSEYYRAYYRRRNREPKRQEQIKAWRRTPEGRASAKLSNRIYAYFKAMESRA